MDLGATKRQRRQDLEKELLGFDVKFDCNQERGLGD